MAPAADVDVDERARGGALVLHARIDVRHSPLVRQLNSSNLFQAGNDS